MRSLPKKPSRDSGSWKNRLTVATSPPWVTSAEPNCTVQPIGEPTWAKLFLRQ